MECILYYTEVVSFYQNACNNFHKNLDKNVCQKLGKTAVTTIYMKITSGNRAR